MLLWVVCPMIATRNYQRIHIGMKLMLSVCSTTGHNLNPVGIAQCEVTLGDASITYSFTVCKHLTKDLVIGLHMQQIYCTDYDWTDNGQMYSHEGKCALLQSLDIEHIGLKLKLVSMIQSPVCSIVTFSTKKTALSTTNPYIYDVTIDESIPSQYLLLHLLLHLCVPITLWNEETTLKKHTVLVCWWMFLILFLWCNRLIFSRTEPNLCLKDKLLPVYNMASSGLWKMFSYIVM